MVERERNRGEVIYSEAEVEEVRKEPHVALKMTVVVKEDVQPGDVTETSQRGDYTEQDPIEHNEAGNSSVISLGSSLDF